MSKGWKSPKEPTHRLKVKDVETDATADVGAGWLNEDGSISVRLNPCVVLAYEDLKGDYLTLFPVNKKEE